MPFKTSLLAAALLAVPAGLSAQAMGTPAAPSSEQPAAGADADADADAQAAAPGGEVAAVTKADLHAGATVLDPAGGTVGTVESVTATGAIVSTGAAKVEIPLASFAKNDRGLVIGMTKAQLEAAAKGG